MKSSQRRHNKFMKTYNRIADSLPPRDGTIKNTIKRLKMWYEGWINERSKK